MHRVLFVFALSLSLFATPSFGKGHGGHGGGHSGGHSAGGGSHGGGPHAGARSSAGTAHSGGMNNGARTNAPKATGRSAARTTGTMPARVTIRPTIRNISTPVVGRGTAPAINNGASYYPYEHYGYGYGYNSYYNPYYSPFYSPYYPMYGGMGVGFFYTPHYYAAGGSSNNYSNDADNYNDGVTNNEFEGYVVYEHDTIPGYVTLVKNKVEIENTDSGKLYDYSFPIKKKGLSYVTLYMDSSSQQLNMVRLPGDSKRLWRVIHEGKLNIYDNRRGFIYAPEDIDARSMIVVYNGEKEAIYTHSIEDTKHKLTAFVNKAYGSNLDPNKFTWKELLVYIDKLD